MTMDWLKENWYRVALIALAVWFLVILSNISFSDSFSIDVCLKEVSPLPKAGRCW